MATLLCLDVAENPMDFRQCGIDLFCRIGELQCLLECTIAVVGPLVSVIACINQCQSSVGTCKCRIQRHGLHIKVPRPFIVGCAPDKEFGLRPQEQVVRCDGPRITVSNPFKLGLA